MGSVISAGSNWLSEIMARLAKEVRGKSSTLVHVQRVAQTTGTTFTRHVFVVIEAKVTLLLHLPVQKMATKEHRYQQQKRARTLGLGEQ